MWNQESYEIEHKNRQRESSFQNGTLNNFTTVGNIEIQVSKFISYRDKCEDKILVDVIVLHVSETMHGTDLT